MYLVELMFVYIRYDRASTLDPFQRCAKFEIMVLYSASVTKILTPVPGVTRDFEKFIESYS